MNKRIISNIKNLNGGKEKTVTYAARIEEIKEERHLIMDVLCEHDLLFRIALTSDDWGIYIPEESKFVGCNKRYYGGSIKPGWQKYSLRDYKYKESLKEIGQDYEDVVLKGSVKATKDFLKVKIKAECSELLNTVLDAIQKRINVKADLEYEAMKNKWAYDLKISDNPTTLAFRKYAIEKSWFANAYVKPYYGKKSSEVLFTCCEKSIPIEKDKIEIGKPYKCPFCQRKVNVLRDQNKRYYFNEAVIYHFQNLKDRSGYVIKYFYSYTSVSNRKLTSNVKEIARLIVRNGKIDKYYNKYSYYTKKTFWDTTGFSLYDRGRVSFNDIGYVYPRGLSNIIGADVKNLAGKEISILNKLPQFDKGIIGILNDAKLHFINPEPFKDSTQTSPEAILGISPKGVETLRAAGRYGDNSLLKWIHFAERNGIQYSDKEIQYCRQHQHVARRSKKKSFEEAFELSKKAFKYAYTNELEDHHILWLRYFEKNKIKYTKALFEKIPRSIPTPDEIPNTLNGLGLFKLLELIELRKKYYWNIGPYVSALEEYPIVEFLSKAGFNRLESDVVYKGHALEFFSGIGPEALGINREEYNRFKAMDGGYTELLWFRHENKTGKRIKDDVICSLSKMRVTPDYVFIKYTTPEKAMNYINKIYSKREQYINHSFYTEYTTANIWNDYCKIAERMNYNLSSDLILKPKDLMAAHDSVLNDEKAKLRKEEVLSRFPEIEKHLIEIKDKYSYRGKNYTAVIPTSVDEIFHEGAALGHCLDSSDIYFQRIQNKESFILFVRRNNDINRPFYTVEFEPGLVVRQKRGTSDRQDEAFDEVVSFLKEWQKECKSRLTQADYELARAAEVERNKNFAELFKTKTQVRNGQFKGQLLGEILKNDLMLAV